MRMRPSVRQKSVCKDSTQMLKNEQDKGTSATATISSITNEATQQILRQYGLIDDKTGSLTNMRCRRCSVADLSGKIVPKCYKMNNIKERVRRLQTVP